MTKLYLAGLLIAMLAFSGPDFAQVLTSENPFPESATQTKSVVFDTTKPVTITGTISQEISRPTSNLSYLFFRVTANGTTWTIEIHDQQLINLAQFCDTCLGDVYTPEMSRVKTGMAVTVQGYETKLHDNRLLLIPATGEKTIAGLSIPDGKN